MKNFALGELTMAAANARADKYREALRDLLDAIGAREDGMQGATHLYLEALKSARAALASTETER